MKLNTRQEQFCLEYAKSGNATEAYKHAGYRCKHDNSAAASAVTLLRNPKIQARLAELHEQMASEKIANAAEIQERLTAILRQEAIEEVIVVEGCGDGISEAVTKTKKACLKDVVAAADKLARMQGAYSDNIALSVAVPVFGGEDEIED